MSLVSNGDRHDFLRKKITEVTNTQSAPSHHMEMKYRPEFQSGELVLSDELFHLVLAIDQKRMTERSENADDCLGKK